MAGRIAKPFIEKLLARVDIVDVIGQAVTLKKAGRDFQGLCPFHNEKTPSFTVSPEKQFYHCFGCGVHGSSIGFLMNHGGLSFSDAVQDLASRSGLEIEYEGGIEAPRQDFAPLYAVLTDAQRLYARQLREHPARARAVDYLKRRGLTGEIAKRFGIGYAPNGWDTVLTALGTSPERQALLQQAGLVIEREGGGYYDRFRDRIIFPINDRRGRCIAFGGRIIDTGEPKYLNSPESAVFHKRRELYGLDLVIKHAAKATRIIIVEGYMDVVALAQHGITNAVATLGTATTQEHLEQLFRVVSDLVFCFDGDAAGKRASWRALETALPVIQDGRRVSFLFLPEQHDPDSLVRTEGPAPFQDPSRYVDLSELLFERLATQTDLHSLEGRARLVALAKPLVQQVPAGTFRQLLAARVAELAQTRVDLERQPSRSAPVAPRRALPQNRGRNVRPNVDKAIALLVHDPSLVRAAEDFPALDVTADPKLAVLVALLELLRVNPALTSGALLEQLRDTPLMATVEEILTVPLTLPRELWAAEFTGALDKLLELARRNYFGKLVTNEGAKPSELPSAVRDRLQRGLPPRDK